MASPVYINALGTFLPGPPVPNDEIEEYLGRIHHKESRARQRILKQNGILTRHYAIDRNQQSLYSNAQMAAHAIADLYAKANLSPAQTDFLGVATSQGDYPLPGFASMVHGELKTPPCEIATFHGVCASGVMALRAAALQVKDGRSSAVACASEFASRLFKATRFEAQSEGPLDFDTEFLRWMLSDGAGAALLQPNPGKLALEIEWIEIVSHANRFEPCMYVGPPRHGSSWLDYPSYSAADRAGAINLRQDIRMLDDVVRCAVDGALDLVRQGRMNPASIDWVVAHYSSHLFREQSHERAARGGLNIALDRWFTNLYTKGNIGAASIFVQLEELFYSGRLTPGERIFCLVPESGRFTFAYMMLKVVEGTPTTKVKLEIPRTEVPHLEPSKDPHAQRLIRELTGVWFEFEKQLHGVPIIQKLYSPEFTLEDYRRLLFNLRQQVIDGSRWIARAASNITAEFFPLRSAFIAHTQEEHRDYEMIERNYQAAGGSLEEIRAGRKNIGSEALSSYVLHRANRENPFDLVGAMFIVEGLGQRVARQWGERIQTHLGLSPDQVSFLIYHSASDVKHFERLDLAIAHGILTDALVDDIVRCAKITGRLYALQLEELDRY
ncbi:MAG: iron-containing redox enzyme family protein [Acidobacteriaceae bacterium]|jgi:3-oxoacyl-[acyl-carrier-protein] synthase-3|nr:iron-containing redox enzyme family protein [Acidobacteriaceae bacterium]